MFKGPDEPGVTSTIQARRKIESAVDCYNVFNAGPILGIATGFEFTAATGLWRLVGLELF
jgi:hypothetical protein